MRSPKSPLTPLTPLTPNIMRRVSGLADKGVKNSIGDRISPSTSIMFMLNSMTGIGILTLPYAFSKAGLCLGALVVFVCMAVAFVTGTFMCEAFSIACAIRYEEAGMELLTIDEDVKTQLVLKSAPLLRKFRIRERMEIGYMGELLLSRKLYSGAVYFVMVVQMYGSNTVLVVLVNKALSNAIVSIAAMCERSLDEASVYRLCVAFIFCVVFPLCLGDLQKTKKFTLVMISLKFTAIFLFMIVATMKAIERLQTEGASPVLNAIPAWNLDYFTLVFSNAVFMFCQHHMLPSMVAPVDPQDKIPRVIGVSFLLIYFFSLSVNATALIAWSEEAAAECSAKAGGHYCSVQPMYNLNFAPLNWLGGVVGIFIVAYPAMSTANFPVQAITTRNTLNLLLGLKPLDPAEPITVHNLSLLLIVLMPPFAVALFTTDVQTMIQYVGGYAGLTIAFLFPLALLVQGRLLLSLTEVQSAERPMKSKFGNTIGYVLVLVFYVVALAVTTNKLFLS